MENRYERLENLISKWKQRLFMLEYDVWGAFSRNDVELVRQMIRDQRALKHRISGVSELLEKRFTFSTHD